MAVYARLVPISQTVLTEQNSGRSDCTGFSSHTRARVINLEQHVSVDVFSSETGTTKEMLTISDPVIQQFVSIRQRIKDIVMARL